MRLALETGVWSVADVALVDDVAARLGPVQDAPREERGFYEIEELDDLVLARRLRAGRPRDPRPGRTRIHPDPDDARERLLQGRIGRPEDYAHVLVDEAQDLSPMQWRMLGRRGRYASWTVVGDAAQSSWPDAAESAVAREEAFGTQPRRLFHMDTNYRNAREIFDYAAAMIRRSVPDADIPQAVRETGVEPVDGHLGPDVYASVAAGRRTAPGGGRGLGRGDHAVEPRRRPRPARAGPDGRVQVTDPMSTKGLEYDATVVVDPDAIVAESPGGARVLYVAMTRAAHRMTVLR